MKQNQASLLFCYAAGDQAMTAINAVPIPVSCEPKGVVYTREWVVNLLLDLAGYVPTANLVDAIAVEPSAGEGAFLGPMIGRLLASCKRLGRAIADCEHSLMAYELDQSSAKRARDFVCELLEREGVGRQVVDRLANSWVRCSDYLFEDWGLEADFVIGNPPYVRLEDMPDTSAAIYRQAYATMRGRADLYVAFFEAALRQLKQGGVCAFICADRWMRNQYGAELRRLVTSDYSVDFLIEMHDAQPF
ncbi:MAG: Eco57I restriction-modification methylase domain-containing protein, partial [Actinomycetota bacterium]